MTPLPLNFLHMTMSIKNVLEYSELYADLKSVEIILKKVHSEKVICQKQCSALFHYFRRPSLHGQHPAKAELHPDRSQAYYVPVRCPVDFFIDGQNLLSH